MEDKRPAVINCKDPLTGLIYRTYAEIRRSAEENVEMYRRHISEDVMIFSVEVIDDRYDGEYRVNAFNSKFKKGESETIIIPKLPDIRWDVTWKLRLNHISEEEKYVKDLFDSFCDHLYKISQNDSNKHKNQHKIYGSCCHRGFINSLFDYHHQSGMSSIRKYVEIIGDCVDNVLENISKLSALKKSQYGGDTIYKNGFYTSYVEKMCEYCEIMFGMSRYEIAKHFEKEDPESFIRKAETSEKDYEKRYLMFCVGAIYAENGEYERALSTLREANKMIRDEHGIFTSEIEDLIRYYETNGTSILSSKF